MSRPINPDVIQERIIRLRAELRRMRAELRLAEAERRDREKLSAEGVERIRKQQKKSPGANLGDYEASNNHAEHTTT